MMHAQPYSLAVHAQGRRHAGSLLMWCELSRLVIEAAKKFAAFLLRELSDAESLVRIFMIVLFLFRVKWKSSRLVSRVDDNYFDNDDIITVV